MTGKNIKEEKNGFLKALLAPVVNYSKMIKLSHTVFALPFALVALVVIWKQGIANISVLKTIYVVVAFTAVRSFSMAVNRIADARIDAANPRTKSREIPKGTLSIRQVGIFAVISVVVVWVFSWLLSPVAFFVSFPALVLLAGYSYSKRFTWLCHLWLGAVIGMAPLGVYIAVVQRLTVEAWVLWVTLSSYIAGFDILYSIQDIEFDRKMKLYSMPSRLGINVSLVVSSVLHVISFSGFLLLGFLAEFGNFYYLGAAVILLMMLGEHVSIGWGKSLKKDKIPVAFFNYNSVISLSFIFFTFLDVVL